MTSLEVRKKLAEIENKAEKGGKDLEEAKEEFHALQKMCPHENKIPNQGGFGLCLDCYSKLP